jgi:hypothetical protein
MAQFGIKKIASKDQAYDVYLLQPLENDEEPFRAMVPKGSPEALFLESAQRGGSAGGKVEQKDYTVANLDLETKGLETVSEQEVALSLERNGQVTYIREATPAVMHNRGITQEIDGETVTTVFSKELDDLTRRKMRLDIYGAMLHNIEEYKESPEAYEMLRGYQQDTAKLRVGEDIQKLKQSRQKLNGELSTSFVGATLKKGFPPHMLGVAHAEVIQAGPQYAQTRLALLNEQVQSGVSDEVMKQTLRGFNMTEEKADNFLTSFKELSEKDRQWFVGYLKGPKAEINKEAFIEASQVQDSIAPFQEMLDSPNGGDKLLSTMQFKGMKPDSLRTLKQHIQMEEFGTSEAPNGWDEGSEFSGPDHKSYIVENGLICQKTTEGNVAVEDMDGFGSFDGPDGSRYLLANGGMLQVDDAGNLAGKNGALSPNLQERLNKTMEGVSPTPEDATPEEQAKHKIDLKMSLLQADPSLLQPINDIQDSKQLERITRLATEFQAQEQDLNLLKSAERELNSNGALPPNEIEDMFREGDTLALDHQSVLHTDELMNGIRQGDAGEGSQKIADFYYKQAFIEDLAARNMMAAHQGHMADCGGQRLWEGAGSNEKILKTANPYLYADANSSKPVAMEHTQRMFKGLSRSCAKQLFSQIAVAKTGGNVKFEGQQPFATFQQSVNGYLQGKEKNIPNILMASGLTVEQARKGTAKNIKDTNQRTLGRIEELKMQGITETGNRSVMYLAVLTGVVNNSLKRAIDPEM